MVRGNHPITHYYKDTPYRIDVIKTCQYNESELQHYIELYKLPYIDTHAFNFSIQYALVIKAYERIKTEVSLCDNSSTATRNTIPLTPCKPCKPCKWFNVLLERYLRDESDRPVFFLRYIHYWPLKKPDFTFKYILHRETSFIQKNYIIQPSYKGQSQ